MVRNISIIGGGLAGLSAACSLADGGMNVSLFEKNQDTGGRNRSFRHDGFTFDMGPSWYWMPEVFENFFARFGKSVGDYYNLVRLDPSYRVFVEKEQFDIPAGKEALKQLFDQLEPGSGQKLDRYLNEARAKYETGMGKFVWKPSRSVWEYADIQLVREAFRLQLFTSVAAHIRQYFRHPTLIQLLEFPVLFLGAKPSRTPALYSMMNYADIELGTWYPMGGMQQVTRAMTELATSLGVRVHTSTPIDRIEVRDGQALALHSGSRSFPVDALIGAADYHHIESQLLSKEERNYSEEYWKKRVMSPSSLLFYVGVKKKLKGLRHHNLFFDRSFNDHNRKIYDTPGWPEEPLFYVCCPSVTDPSVAPDGMENLFFLVPVATGLTSTEEERQRYFEQLVSRVEERTGQTFRDDIIYSRSYAHEEFIHDYNAYRGNAYGLANTLRQTAFLKPAMHSRKVSNLFFAGQLTVPGPGVPPAIISGQLAASEATRYLDNFNLNSARA